jgi:hypothetical protein
VSSSSHALTREEWADGGNSVSNKRSRPKVPALKRLSDRRGVRGIRHLGFSREKGSSNPQTGACDGEHAHRPKRADHYLSSGHIRCERPHGVNWSPAVGLDLILRLVPRARVELATRGFSVRCSTGLSYLGTRRPILPTPLPAPSPPPPARRQSAATAPTSRRRGPSRRGGRRSVRNGVPGWRCPAGAANRRCG